MARHSALLIDIALLSFALFLLCIGPPYVERALAKRLPLVVDCSVPLVHGKIRVELVRADGREILKCKDKR